MAFDLTKLPKKPTLKDILEMNNYTGGYWDDEQYNTRGQGALEAIKKFDPNASWVEEQSGGEGGSSHLGYRLNYDTTKLPKNVYGKPGTFGVMTTDDPATGKLDYGNLKNAKDRKYDENYGWLTDSHNKIKAKDPAWTRYAPLVVAALASGGAALGAAPAMAGVAGGTAGVTGGAAGLAAGNIATAGAGGLFGGAINSAVKGLPGTASNLSHGNFNPAGLAGMAAGFIPGLSNISQYLPYAQMANQAYNFTRQRGQ